MDMERFEWVYDAFSTEASTDLATSLNLSPHFGHLLYKRGIQDFASAKKFFCPSFDQLHSPFLMKDMDKAIERITLAIEKKERILIYGDYDVDGTTSITTLLLFLTDILGYDKKNIDFYIPDRLKEGYGLQEFGVAYILDHKPDLLIMVDCGTTSVEHVQHIRSQGIACIICDHHLAKENLPTANAILNPKQTDCAYPYKELSACAIVFKLIQGLASHLHIPDEAIIPLLDLVALSTASDIVPLTGENRILMHLGIHELKQERRLSVRYLKNATQVNDYSVRSIVFGIAPSINAAGRMSHAKEVVNLLLCDDVEKIKAYATRLQQLNTERREVQRHMLDEAMQQYQQSPSPFSIAVSSQSWQKGVLGIVASKLSETFYKPSIVFKEEGDLLIGSARSIDEVNLYEALQQCDLFIESFGGHAQAAGLKVKVDQKANFCTAFEQAIRQQLQDQIPQPKLYIDSEICLSHIHPKMMSIVQRMEPFGPQNHNPLWISKPVRLVQEPTLLKDKHLRCKWEQDGVYIDAMLFGHAQHYLPHLQKNHYYQIAFKLKQEHWNGEDRIACYIEDIRRS